MGQFMRCGPEKAYADHLKIFHQEIFWTTTSYNKGSFTEISILGFISKFYKFYLKILKNGLKESLSQFRIFII